MPTRGPRWPEKMNQMKTFVEEYYFRHNTQPQIKLIAETFELSRATTLRYIAEMKKHGMIENRKKGIITKKMRQDMDRTESAARAQGRKGLIGGLTVLSRDILGEELYTVKILDDSLKGSDIQRGDTLLVRRKNTAEDGEMIIARAGGWNVIGRYYSDKQTGRAIIRRENMRMPDICTDDYRILGVVAHVIHCVPEVRETSTNEAEGTELVRCGEEKLIPIRMMDDSMKDAGICVGDILLARKTKKVEEGDTVIATINGINIIGRIRINRNQTRPDETMLCTTRSVRYDIDDCDIIGVVVHVFHELQPTAHKKIVAC